jgi:hypothetical protein
MSDEEERIKKVYENTGRRVPDLVVSRVPKQVLEGIKKLASEEFCDDYGMAIKFLYDNTYGVLPQILSDYEARIGAIENKIAMISNKNEVETETKQLKTNSGKVIEVRKDDQ